jgi:hypothetical protein
MTATGSSQPHTTSPMRALAGLGDAATWRQMPLQRRAERSGDYQEAMKLLKCHGGQGEKRSKGGTSLFPTNQRAEMMPHHLGPVRRSLRDSLCSIKLEARIDGWGRGSVMPAHGSTCCICLPKGVWRYLSHDGGAPTDSLIGACDRHMTCPHDPLPAHEAVQSTPECAAPGGRYLKHS